MQGTVLSFNAGKGWGFIQPDAGGDNVMLHVRELADQLEASQIREGVRVEFDVRSTPRGLRGMHVRVLRGAREESGFLAEVSTILRDAEDRLAEAARRYGVAG